MDTEPALRRQQGEDEQRQACGIAGSSAQRTAAAAPATRRQLQPALGEAAAATLKEYTDLTAAVARCVSVGVKDLGDIAAAGGPLAGLRVRGDTCGPYNTGWRHGREMCSADTYVTVNTDIYGSPESAAGVFDESRLVLLEHTILRVMNAESFAGAASATVLRALNAQVTRVATSSTPHKADMGPRGLYAACVVTLHGAAISKTSVMTSNGALSRSTALDVALARALKLGAFARDGAWHASLAPRVSRLLTLCRAPGCGLLQVGAPSPLAAMNNVTIDLVAALAEGSAADFVKAANAAAQAVQCGSCGEAPTSGAPFLLCEVCRKVHYCGAECQKRAWKEHRKACKGQAGHGQ